MARYREQLPQLGGGVFLTDSGLETDLIFNRGIELPHFAAFVLLADDAGREILRSYFRDHAAIAREAGAGFVLESVTWRANPDWGEKLGYTPEALAAANEQAVAMLAGLRDEVGEDAGPVVVSGCVGPRGDGYSPGEQMTAVVAQGYHATQVGTFAGTDADLVHAMTITYPDEAIGIVRAAAAAGIPVAISFTVETDGRLPDGTSLGDGVTAVDDATGGAAAYFGINCAHPTHFGDALEPGASWTTRIRTIRANASRRTHAELDESEELDAGDPAELGDEYRELRTRFPDLSVLGGCCGTDARHVRAVANACVTRSP